MLLAQSGASWRTMSPYPLYQRNCRVDDVRPEDVAALEKWPSATHIQSMAEFVEWLTGTHKCECGAKYKVTVTETPSDRATCEKCGILMDRPANKSLLTYERIPGDE